MKHKFKSEQEKAKEAWKNYLTNRIVRGQYYSAISDFQIAIIEAFNEEINEIKECAPLQNEQLKFMAGCRIDSLERAIDIVKTLTPKESKRE